MPVVQVTEKYIFIPVTVQDVIYTKYMDGIGLLKEGKFYGSVPSQEQTVSDQNPYMS